MRTCKVFDKYRDGELNAAEREAFESHLAFCEDCRTKMSLLNNIVHVLKQEELRPLDIADRVARRAFRRGKSWDSLVVSWVHPGPALAALATVLVLVSLLWFAPGNRQMSLYSEYEKLMEEADAVNLGVKASQLDNDSELMFWLQQEGNSQ